MVQTEETEQMVKVFDWMWDHMIAFYFLCFHIWYNTPPSPAINMMANTKTSCDSEECPKTNITSHAVEIKYWIIHVIGISVLSPVLNINLDREKGYFRNLDKWTCKSSINKIKKLSFFFHKQQITNYCL